MSAHSIKATHAAIKAYRAALREFAAFRADHEGATETAFGRLLADTGRAFGWTLIPKQSMKVDGKNIIPDGTLRDLFLVRGHWEAKDTDDDLDTEIKKKIKRKYPLTNIIFDNGGHSIPRTGCWDAISMNPGADGQSVNRGGRERGENE
jgi:hypothetical protein